MNISGGRGGEVVAKTHAVEIAKLSQQHTVADTANLSRLTEKGTYSTLHMKSNALLGRLETAFGLPVAPLKVASAKQMLKKFTFD